MEAYRHFLDPKLAGLVGLKVEVKATKTQLLTFQLYANGKYKECLAELEKLEKTEENSWGKLVCYLMLGQQEQGVVCI